jgi:hypothetical protein
MANVGARGRGFPLLVGWFQPNIVPSFSFSFFYQAWTFIENSRKMIKS